jgi:L-alanine-DL-glutamate epimerase-like enolase superfamily enzyme
MKIKHIHIEKIDLGTQRPYTIAYKTVDKVENVILRLELENGLVGYGAANPSKMVVGEDVDDSFAYLKAHAEACLLGKDIRRFESLLKELELNFAHKPGSRAALDIAVHDAFAKYLEVPLVKFFGQEKEEMPTSITIGIKSLEETMAEAEEYYGMGFRYFKIKVGQNVEEDIERLIKLDEQYEDKINIRVDANQGYSDAELYRFFQATRSIGLELIEQPLRADDIDGMRRLQPALRGMMAADESLKTPTDALNLIEKNACGIFNIKLMKSGGIDPAREIATIAQWYDVPLMWGCNDESAISLSAALHTAFSFKNTQYLDLDGSLDLLHDVVQGGFTIEKGMMRVAHGAGLGLEWSL